VLIIIVIAFTIYQNDKYQSESAERITNNKALREQCITQVTNYTLSLKQQATNSNTYTKAYDQQLARDYTSAINHCKSTYPLY
jgi:hypothetical protein